MNFFKDLKDIVSGELKRLGIKFAATDDVEVLLLLACNHELKNIKQCKREVHTSVEFEAALKQLPPVEQAAAKAIQLKFVNGDDVSGHLSRGSGADRADEIDQLLADWGIHHLHISNHKTHSTDAFFARTGPVMFVHVTKTGAYFIDIFPHGGWTRQKLLDIADRTWPNLYEHSCLPTVMSVAFTPTDEDIKKLRGPAKKVGSKGKAPKKSGGAVSAIIPVGGSFLFSPGGGLASDGTPIVSVSRTHSTLRLVQRMETWATQNEAKLKSATSKLTGVPEAKLDFELVPLSPPGFGIREKTTGTMVYETPQK